MTSTAAARRYITLGTTDEWDACDCCGKMNLKVYVVLKDTETDEVLRMGTSCAARHQGIPAAAVRKAARTADDERKAAERAERDAAHRAEAERWFAWLTDHAGPGETPDQISRLGGYAVARAAFRAAA